MKKPRFRHWLGGSVLGLVLVRSVFGSDVPEPCEVFLDTVERCEKYDRLKNGSGWEVQYSLVIKKEGKPRDVSIARPQLNESSQSEFLRYTDHQGVPVLLFDSSRWGQVFLKIGPTVSGEFAIEVRAMAISSRLNDLSIILDDLDQPGSFQFGGWENTRNTLCLGQDAQNKPVLVEGDPNVKIKPGVWHRIRLEVSRDEIRGLVDGRMVVRGKPPSDHDFLKKRQPLFYLYASTAVISDYRVEYPQSSSQSDQNAEQIWKEAFDRKTQEQVMSDLRELTRLLNHPSYEVRQSASELLFRAGRLAEQPLREATRTGALEGRERARSLLRQFDTTIAED